MKIPNNTHYYSICNRTYNIIPDNDSWQFESSKRMSYSQRLYWEYKFVKSCGGQAYFYTFTYNDVNLPYFEYDTDVYDESTQKWIKKHIKTACFNYNHIRLLTNGIISKILRRKYGSQLRYFVACERGEGKGKHRKKGQNPHYHVIFFISPLPDKIRNSKDVPYKRISPIQFCHLCKCVWQYNSTPNKYDHLVADYKSARFGHCQPGNDLGYITDFDALSYVSKYVCKDSAQFYDDRNIKDYYVHYFKELGMTYHALYSYYYFLRQDGQIIDRKDFIDYSYLNAFYGWRTLTGRRDISYGRFLELEYSNSVFFKDFTDYFNRLYLPCVAESSYRNYVNVYGSKVRTSKSLGCYGLNYVQDPSTNPHFTLNKSDEVINQPICMYYFRKLYMNVVKCSHTGNPLYVLNENGVELKCLFLRSNIERIERKVYEAFDSIDRIPEFNLLLLSKGLTSSILNGIRANLNISNVVYEFAVYRFVYQYRHYSNFELDLQPAIDNGLSFDNVLSDYRGFLKSNFYTCDYDELKLITMVENYRFPNLVSFDCHWCFASRIAIFDLISNVLELYTDFTGKIKKHNFANSVELRQLLNAYKYNPLV